MFKKDEIVFPYGKWVWQNDDKMIFLDNIGNLVYETNELSLLGDIGFVLPFNIGSYDHTLHEVEISNGRTGSNSAILHYKESVTVLPGTKIDSIVCSTEDFLIYTKDKGLTHCLAIYDPIAKVLKDEYLLSEYMEILDSYHILSRKNEVYSLVTAIPVNTPEGQMINTFIQEPIGMEKFEIKDNALYTINGVFIRRL